MNLKKDEYHHIELTVWNFTSLAAFRRCLLHGLVTNVVVLILSMGVLYVYVCFSYAFVYTSRSCAHTYKTEQNSTSIDLTVRCRRTSKYLYKAFSVTSTFFKWRLLTRGRAYSAVPLS